MDQGCRLNIKKKIIIFISWLKGVPCPCTYWKFPKSGNIKRKRDPGTSDKHLGQFLNINDTLKY